jgi:hypothetical protein
VAVEEHETGLIEVERSEALLVVRMSDEVAWLPGHALSLVGLAGMKEPGMTEVAVAVEVEGGMTGEGRCFRS